MGLEGQPDSRALAEPFKINNTGHRAIVLEAEFKVKRVAFRSARTPAESQVLIVAVAEPVVVGAGAGRRNECGHCLGVQRVDEVLVADVLGVHGFLLPGLDGQGLGPGIVPAGLRRRVAAGASPASLRTPTPSLADSSVWQNKPT